MAVVLLGLAAVVLGLWAAGRYGALRHMVGIGRAGIRAEVVPLDPDLLHEVVREVMPDVEAAGFRLVAASRTNIG
jgi:hypothetical protein